MKKKLIALLLGVTVVLGLSGMTACKKEAPEYTVGICQFNQHESLDAASKGFKAALTDKLGDAVSFDEQNAGGDLNICSTILNDFISEKADLILANSTNALQAAAAATSEIPILGTSVTAYDTALQLTDFNGTVGGNISGTSDLVPPDVLADVIRELFPEAGQIGMLYCSSETNSEYQVEKLQAKLQEFGYSCKSYLFIDSTDLSAVTMDAASECDVIYVPTDNLVAANAELIANICIPDKVPVITGDESTCQICGVATLTIDYYQLGYATGEMAAQVLTGEKDISQMPLQYAPEFTKKYNAKICETLGLSVPENYVALETE